MFGILNINKPAGLTSRDVVNHVQRRVRPHKVGHAGTLDPLATGVLVLCVGPATKLIEYVQRMPKRYRATFRLGCHSETEDVEGEGIELTDAPRPSPAALEEVMPRFLGKIQQRPPAYSALKINGERAYKLARAGQAVDVQPREVEIYELRCVEYDYPRLALEVTCGSGTYIRSLGRDIAEALGTAAVMEALVRTAIGPFTLAEATPPRLLPVRAAVVERLQSPQTAVSMLPTLTVNETEITEITNGRFLTREDAPAEAQEIAAVDASGTLIAILARRNNGQWRPAKNFSLLRQRASTRGI